MAKTRTLHVYSYEKDGSTLYYVTFYCKQWDGTNKKIKKMGFTRQADAARYEQDYRDRLAGSPAMTFAALCDRFLDDYRHHVRESTYLTTRNLLVTYLFPAFGDKTLTELTPVMIREWQNRFISSRHYQPTTLSKIHASLVITLNYACKYFGLAKNPATIAGGMGSQRPAHDMQYWTREQFARFILSGLKPEYIAMFSTLFWTGCRSGECLALTAGDIDLEQGIMGINKTMTKTEHGYIVGPPKTAHSRRKVSLPRPLVMILADWIRRTDARSNDRLFTRDRTTYAAALKQHAQQVGLSAIRLHDLRHSHASMLINLGTPPKVYKNAWAMRRYK
ncbi:site-specific integrase [Selenomonas sp. WCA-380-WT-3B 3/]|uniref:Site-specific integrase n=1 Tax=Selenomonas montiformis TaxID=2652285 RepID=A0A6I2UWU3_9FIRM|nr:site-specific integrase [Selenomonas montiformis]MSV24845.1 site-specific integrase [Selenomonas montiformis]